MSFPDAGTRDVRESGFAANADDSHGDLSRYSWSQFEKTTRRSDNGALLEQDAAGHITKVSNTDGSVYQYSKFDSCGQPTVCKITDTKTGDWGYWKKEDEGLWRSYNKEKPNYEVLRGSWTVDDNGIMRMHGVQDTKELPPAIVRDKDGHITKMKTPYGETYEYSKFDDNGQPQVCKIIDNKTGKHGYWKKEEEGLWRAYDGEKPMREVVRGCWTVDDKGVMHMQGTQDFADIPKRIPRADASQSTDHTIKAGPDGVPHRPPDGYHAIKGHIPTEVVVKARSLLSGDYGTMTPFEVDGRKFMARVEPHYHPEGYKNGPTGWHKGVTVYEAA